MRSASRAEQLPAIRAIVDELEALRARGAPTGEAFDDAYDRAIAAVDAAGVADGERTVQLNPVLHHGTTVGRLRE